MVLHRRPSLTADRHRRLLPLTGGSASLTGVDRRATWRLDKWEGDTCHPRYCSRYKVQRYEVQMEAEGSVPGVDPEGPRMPRSTLSLVDMDIES
nr:hypothetical protein [Tanacetum cinerariifolium]